MIIYYGVKATNRTLRKHTFLQIKKYVETIEQQTKYPKSNLLRTHRSRIIFDWKECRSKTNAFWSCFGWGFQWFLQKLIVLLKKFNDFNRKLLKTKAFLTIFCLFCWKPWFFLSFLSFLSFFNTMVVFESHLIDMKKRQKRQKKQWFSLKKTKNSQKSLGFFHDFYKN